MAMALATASSQLRSYEQDPYVIPSTSAPYEEEIVPALRRRLAQESRELSKRISAHLVSSKEDSDDVIISGGEPSFYPISHSNKAADSSGGLANKTEPNFSVQLSRKRTYSTPYPFDAASESSRQSSRPPFRSPRVLRSSSTVTTPLVPTPSRIPKPSTRPRSTSKSSTNAPLPKPSTALVEASFGDIQFDTIQSEPSESGHQTAEASNLVSHSDDTHNISDAQAHFEHWYRGEGRDGGGRNGGRGEIRAGTQEMLTIALSGHASAHYQPRESWVPSLVSHIDEGEYSDSQERWRMGVWAQDSVLDERMLTDMEGDGEGTDADTLGGPTTPTLAASQLPNAQPPQSTPRRTAARSTHSQSTPTQSRVRSVTGQSSPSGAKRTSPAPKRSRPAAQVRRKSSFPPATSNSASRSAYDLSSLSALADAVPRWESPPSVPPSGNWDEVVLPTIAKKMRMAQSGSAPEVVMLGAESTNKAQRDSFHHPMIPPAPGTFAYDSSKAQPRSQPESMLDTQQFGKRQTDLEPETSNMIVSEPITYQAQQQSLRAESTKRGPAESREQLPEVANDLLRIKPSIKVTSPSLKSQRAAADEHDGGCCKCVVM